MRFMIRPWFRGGGSRSDMRLWRFEGIDPEISAQFEKLSGPSAGQSSLVHALDIFLGVNHSAPRTASHSPSLHATSTTCVQLQTPEPKVDTTFMTRMLYYMPLAHRVFLGSLRAYSPSLRELVLKSRASAKTSGLISVNFALMGESGVLQWLFRWVYFRSSEPERQSVAEELSAAYNDAVKALKRFRDSHTKVVRSYIIDQAAKVHAPDPLQASTKAVHYDIERSMKNLHGTGGTFLMPFLRACG